MIEEFVIQGRKKEYVTDERLLAELKKRGFEPQIVGEIDPPPKNGGSWVLRDKRDRRSHEDGGVWIAWTRPRGGEQRRDCPTRYVVETFDGRSGYDWFLSIAVTQAIAEAARGVVSADGGPERELSAFQTDLAKDPSTRFDGPESVVDWEAQNLEEDLDEDEEGEEDDEDEYEEDEEGEDEDEDYEEDEEDE